jgi:hypothetical protein
VLPPDNARRNSPRAPRAVRPCSRINAAASRAKSLVRRTSGVIASPLPSPPRIIKLLGNRCKEQRRCRDGL